MAPRTRASRPAAGRNKHDDDTDTPKLSAKKLDASVDNPPQLFVLPKNASPDARIASIANPATSQPSRYFVCPNNGFYEFTSVSAPTRQPRSWLLAPDSNDRQEEEKEEAPKSDATAYMLQAPDVFVATAIDPLFLLLPSLAGDGDSVGQEYLDATDYSAKLGERSPHFSQVLPNASGKLAQAIEARIAAVCDSMSMGDDVMYALSLPKLVKELATKAKRMAAGTLPPSIEDHFVKQALEVPVLSVEREESNVNVATDDASAGAESHTASAVQSQESDTTATSTAVSTAATSVATSGDKDHAMADNQVTALLRLRVSFDFLLRSYISPSLQAKLEPMIANAKISSIDFSPLNKYLDHVAALKKDALALRSLSDNISRKRSALDDDEAMEKAETKKRKKEEEESRKKNMSQGVKKLMKADTSGMKKLSSFFAKAPAKA